MTTSTRFTKMLLAYIIIFAAVGLWDAFSIHLKEIEGATNPNVFKACNLNSILDCGTVARSKASQFLGVPVSLFGVLFYQASLFLGACLALEFPILSRRWLLWSINLVMATALLFSFRLLYISWFGLGVLCPYCLTSNLSTLIVVVSWFLFVLTKKRLYKPE